MTRREFLSRTPLRAAALATAAAGLAGASRRATAAEPVAGAGTEDWLARWEPYILSSARDRYCDREMGEELGWLVSPFLEGFYQGYRATGDARWVERLADWGDAWVRRGVQEPDGFVGWPKGGTGGAVAKDLYTDSQLGEAMALRPMILMAAEILKAPALKQKFGASAEAWLALAQRTFEKWDARGCWREVKDGGLWVVPEFGIDRATNGWTAGYERRKTSGFSHPANKQNHIARWLLALSDVTQTPLYRERAAAWWRVMKSRIRTREDGKFAVWNYWDPAGPWDYNADGSTRHWVGVHPNGGYYDIDVQGMAAAFEHGLVFGKDDIARLVATNRDFMWSQQRVGAKFRRIDGGEPDARWKDSPGVLWTALVPHDKTLREVFVANHNPASWGGLSVTPWFLSLK